MPDPILDRYEIMVEEITIVSPFLGVDINLTQILRGSQRHDCDCSYIIINID